MILNKNEKTMERELNFKNFNSLQIRRLHSIIEVLANAIV